MNSRLEGSWRVADGMIRGMLAEFSLAELIRLVSETHKTGVLELSGPGGSGELLFCDGCICGSRTDAHREPLGRKLVRTQALSEPELWSALEEQAGGRQRLGQLLIAGGSVTPEQVQSALQEQIEDAALDILTLAPTDFVWRPESPGETGPVLLEPEVFLSVVAERARELREIRSRIPATDVHVSISPTPPHEALKGGIGREEWQLIAMLGSRRTVADLTRYSGAGSIHTLRALDRLIEEGLLELGSTPGRRPPDPVAERSVSRGATPTRDSIITLPDEPGTTPQGLAAEPFTISIVTTSNRPQALLGAGILRSLTNDVPVAVGLHRLDDLGPVAPSAEALLAAERLGIDVTSQPARQLRKGELAGSDLVVGLDWWHVDRAVSYGGAARSRAFTGPELVRLLQSDDADSRETRLVSRARQLVDGAHRLRLKSTAERVDEEEIGFSVDDPDNGWAQLAKLLFSIETVGETS